MRNFATFLLGAAAACAPAHAPDEPAAPGGQLAVISDQPAAGSPYAQWGLTGENKPNGPEYRFRQSVPAATPSFVPRARDGLELMIADPTPDGWLAFYKGPLPPDWGNAEYRAALYGQDGSTRFDLRLNGFLSAERHLEIQDVRYADGALYFNEACQTYSRDAGGRCSALLRLDPYAQRIVWRTPPLTSNNIFLLYDDYVIAGYGFTAEPDSLYLLRRRDGSSVDRIPLDTAHRYLEIRDGVLHVLTHQRLLRLRLPR